MGLLRRWDIIVTWPARVLMRRLTSGCPRIQVNGIELLVASPGLVDKAQLFFARTSEAIESALTEPMRRNTAFRQDVRQIILWDGKIKSFYQRFQLAILVPPEIAFATDKLSYTAWLLYVAGLSRNKRFSRELLEKFLLSLERMERSRIEEWLSITLGDKTLHMT